LVLVASGVTGDGRQQGRRTSRTGTAVDAVLVGPTDGGPGNGVIVRSRKRGIASGGLRRGRRAGGFTEPVEGRYLVTVSDVTGRTGDA